MPFTSKKQQRKCYALKARGQAGSWDCDEFAEHTDFRTLPEEKKGGLQRPGYLQGGIMPASTSAFALGALAAKRADDRYLNQPAGSFRGEFGLPAAATRPAMVNGGAALREGREGLGGMLRGLGQRANIGLSKVPGMNTAGRGVATAVNRLAGKPMLGLKGGRLGAAAGIGGGLAGLLALLTSGGGGNAGAASAAAPNLGKQGADRAFHRLLVKQAAAYLQAYHRQVMDRYLDKLAAALPGQAAVPVRRLQVELAGGARLPQALKVAFPHLSGEGRGVMAVHLVKAAMASCSGGTMKKKKPYNVTAKPGTEQHRAAMYDHTVDAA